MHRRTTLVAVFVAVFIGALAAAHAPAAHAATSNAYLLRERLCLLQGYIERWANGHYSYYPPPRVVLRGGGLKAPLWPVNPWTGRAMVAGGGIGDYSYRPAKDRLSYRLSARHPGGTITLKGTVPNSRKMQNDHRTREGLELVQQYIEAWARSHNDLYPAVAEVDREGSVGRQPGIIYWPHDPWTHHNMCQAKAWGNFTYKVSDARDKYSITAHYSRGGTFTLRGATATAPWHRLRLALNDEIVKRGLDVVDGALRLYATGEGGTLPTPEQLSPAGAAGVLIAAWPSDPYSGTPLTQGDGVGHFSYTSAADGSYTLAAPLAGSLEPYVLHGQIGSTGPAEARDAERSPDGWRPPGR